MAKKDFNGITQVLHGTQELSRLNCCPRFSVQKLLFQLLYNIFLKPQLIWVFYIKKAIYLEKESELI